MSDLKAMKEYIEAQHAATLKVVVLDADTASALIACAEALERIDKWLEKPSDKGGCNLDHVPEAFMEAFGDADLRLVELENAP